MVKHQIRCAWVAAQLYRLGFVHPGRRHSYAERRPAGVARSSVGDRFREVVAELLRAPGRAELLQCLGLNLAHALAGDR